MSTFADITTLAFLGQLGWLEILALCLLGVLIFGKRLPEVGKSLGKGIVEFKKGLSGIEDDVNQAAKAPPRIDNQATSGPTVDTTKQPETEQRPSA